MEDEESQKPQGPGAFAAVAAILSIAVAGAVFVVWAIELRTTTDPTTLQIVTNHFPAVIGLPMAAVGAFIIVVLLRHAHGPIEFEGLGFRFRGSSGPVVMWIACFLAISGAIKLLW